MSSFCILRHIGNFQQITKVDMMVSTLMHEAVIPTSVFKDFFRACILEMYTSCLV